MATPSPVTGRRPFRRLVTPRRATFALVGVMGVLFASAPAQADPGPATSTEAADLVAARGHDLEVVTEKFNTARETYAAQKAAAEAAAAQVDRARKDLAAAQQHVRGVARSAFTGSGLSSFQALMTSDTADEFVDRVGTLQTIAGHQGQILDKAAAAGVAAARAQTDAKKSAAAAKATYDAIAKQQADLKAQIADYQAQFDRLSAQEQRAAMEAQATRASRADRQPGAGAATAQAPAAAPAPAAPAVPAAAPVVAGSRVAQTVVAAAMAQRGKPYVWAAAGPGSFDCSGLTQFAFRAAGIALPHSSSMQATMGQSVSRDQLQPGDLVFFYRPVSHVGIYIGNGQMVHAPTSGDVVKVTSIDAMGEFSGAKRLG